MSAKEVTMIPLDDIRVVNPRSRDRRKFEQVVESIRCLGLKKPIQVCPRNGSAKPEDPPYDLICGQGRIEAFQALGYGEIPAMIVHASREDRMIMSLVENIARRISHPQDLIVEIERLRRAGYTNVAIGKKLGISDTMVRGLITLHEAGEQQLLTAAINGAVSYGVAIEIAKAETPEAQRELLKAYQAGKLTQEGIRVVRRLMALRNHQKKGERQGAESKRSARTTANSLVNAFKRESQRQRLLVRKAKLCDAQLMFVVTAFRRLTRDEDFSNLLRAERLETMPAFLAEKLKPESNQP